MNKSIKKKLLPDIIISVILLLLQIMLLIFSLLADSNNFEEPYRSIFSGGNTFFIALFFAIGTFELKYIVDTIRQNEKIINIENISGDILARIQTNSNLSLRGLADQTALEVINKIESADYIHNTFFYKTLPYAHKTAININRILFNALQDEKTLWVDIFAEPENDRLKLINEKIKAGTVIFDYKPYVLKKEYKNFPLSNFIVLQYKDKSIFDEVYFGWGFTDNEAGEYEEVFWSNDENLVNYYLKLHKKLVGRCYLYEFY